MSSKPMALTTKNTDFAKRRESVEGWLALALIEVCYLSSAVAPVSAINKVAFVGVMIVFLIGTATQRNATLPTFAPLILLWVFVYGYVLSLESTADATLARQFALCPAVLFLIYPVLRYGIDLEPIVKRAGLFMAYVTIICYFSDVVIRDGVIATAITKAFTEYGAGAYGEREYYPVIVSVFAFGAVSFLFVPFSICCLQMSREWSMKAIANVGMLGFAIYLSTARAVIIVSILGLGLAVSRVLSGYKRIVAYALVFSVVISGLWFAGTETAVFSADEKSNFAKIGHATSFFDNLTTWNFIFGEGLASYYYSEGSGTFKAHTEITYLDFCRYVGVPLATLIFWLLLFPSLRVWHWRKRNKEVLVTALLFVALSFTNPTLLNSIGLLGMLWYWSVVLQKRRQVSDGRSPTGHLRERM